MPADAVRRRMAQGLAAALFAGSVVVAGPAVSQAQAAPPVPDWLNPCNAPGGKVACDKAEKGARWIVENSGAIGAVETVTTAVDFATDPLGYLEGKLRAGTKGMFDAFGEQLTGKKPSEPGKKPDAEPEGGKS